MLVATHLNTTRNINEGNTLTSTGTAPALDCDDCDDMQFGFKQKLRDTKTERIMNMKKSIKILAQMTAVGALASLAQNAQSQVIYQNDTVNLNHNYSPGQAGNEVVLAGSAASDLITAFSLQFDVVGPAGGSPNGNAVLNFYENNGPLVSGAASPGTLLYSTAPFSLSTLTSFTTGAILNYTAADFGGTGVVVPKDFTWTVSFTGLTGGDTAGLSEFGPHATVGANFGDAWENTSGSWNLLVASKGFEPLTFGAVIDGTPISTVPDSSSLPLSALAVLAGFGWMKRSQREA
jgi:hypothetical protein